MDVSLLSAYNCLMHPNAKNLAGRRFGKLTALNPTDQRRDNKVVWRCACDCGGEKGVGASALLQGVIKSCGCLRSEVRRKWSPGDRFGRLVLLRYVGPRSAEYVCDCGTRKVCSVSNVSKGTTTSCGCFRAEANTTHGLSRHPLYKRWHAMLDRCRNPKHESFRHYGARGIAVCDRWLSFENFLADMGPPPTPRHTVDRRNVNLGYSPGNCRWSTQAEQMANRRSRRQVVLDQLSTEDLERLLLERSLSASAQKERHLSADITDTDQQRPAQALGETGKPL